MNDNCRTRGIREICSGGSPNRPPANFRGVTKKNNKTERRKSVRNEESRVDKLAKRETNTHTHTHPRARTHTHTHTHTQLTIGRGNDSRLEHWRGKIQFSCDRETAKGDKDDCSEGCDGVTLIR